MTLQLCVPPLSGQHVRLEPLATSHVDELVQAAGEDRSSYGFTSVPTSRDAMRAYVDALVDLQRRGETIAFAQNDIAGNRVVGVTRYLTLRTRVDADAPYAVEIGGTWLAASAQRTRLNTEAKLLLLGHAFDTWRVVRADIKTDARNERARAAIERLGATFEGILRQWQPSQVEGEEHLYRDTAMYSIIASQWPKVRDNLRSRLQPGGRPRLWPSAASRSQ